MQVTRVSVKVIPNARENQLIGYRNNYLEIKVKAPARDNQANRELIAFLSTIFEIPKKDISLIRGGKAKYKTILVNGKTLDQINKIIISKEK